jgi:hypothetical protein
VAQHPPQGSVHRHADERDDLRAERRDLLLQNPPAFDVFRRLQDVDAGARTRDQIGHPDAPLRQSHVVVVRDRLGDDAGFVEKPPEAIRRPREVMAGERRHDTGVDPDEQHAHARLDSVGEPEMLVVRLWAPGFRL